MSNFVMQQIEGLIHVAEPLLSSGHRDAILGAELARTAAPLLAKDEVPVTAVLRLSLLNDCVRIAERVVKADGQASTAELNYLFPLLRNLASLMSRLRASYAEYERLTPAQAGDLLQQHESDAQPFGGICKRTEWSGFAACHHLARLSGSDEPLRKYAALMSRLIDELSSHGGQTEVEERTASALRALVSEQTQIEEDVEYSSDNSARVAAFCSPHAKNVFHAVAYAGEIWERDPFDVDAVHAEARQVFDITLDQVHDASSRAGRSLLLLGESGAGKTHLLRAFRAMAHGSFRAMTGYLQLNVETMDYRRLLVQRLVDSMDRPYDLPRKADSALSVLSDALAARIGDSNDARLKRLQDGELTTKELAALTHELADAAYQRGLGEVHADLMRAFLLLQRRDPALRQRVLKLLRCEHLSSYEQEMLGDIAPWTDDGADHRMLVQLGKLAWEANGSALLLLIDQVEDLMQQGSPSLRFRRVADALRSITDDLPHCLVVLASLDDFFENYARDLTKAVRDRLERDPAPVRLTSERDRDEIHELVIRRLNVLYDDLGVAPSEDQPLFPFTADALQPLIKLRTRDVIDWCANYQRRCREQGALIDFGTPDPQAGAASKPEPTPSNDADGLQAQWKKMQQSPALPVPSDDRELVTLIAWGFERLGDEVRAQTKVSGALEDGCLLELSRGGPAQRIYAGISNKMPQGGHLKRQLLAMAAEAKAHGARLSLLRCGEFPERPRTQIAELLGKLVKTGARKVVVANEELRLLVSLRAFWGQHPSVSLRAWSESQRPFSQLSIYQHLIELGELDTDPQTQSKPPREAAEAKADAQEANPRATDGTNAGAARPFNRTLPPPPGCLNLGRGLGLRGPAVTLETATLCKHTAIVGATGSGKTTLALAILEQVLNAGIPVVMVDRKGDLCTYADPAFWAASEGDPERDRRKRALREQLEVKIYTPGDGRGRPLSIQLAPAGLGELPMPIRNAAATHAAAALAAMVGIKAQPHEQKLSILAKSIDLLAESGSAVTIELLTEMIRHRDPDLMNQVGAFKDSHFDILAERLLSLSMLNRQLFDADGDSLTADLVFGRGPYARPGKTRLTVISTKGLRNEGIIEFWVAQLLSELLAWASRNPSPKLQAMVFLDEADLYLPATSKPATKDPILDLLKRGRSAGLGVMLGTQNPGDFDYKARGNLNAWFLGRVSQVNDLKRMKPLLSEARTDISGKLANAGRGEFYLLEAGKVSAFAASRSLMVTRQLSEQEILEFARRG